MFFFPFHVQAYRFPQFYPQMDGSDLQVEFGNRRQKTQQLFMYVPDQVLSKATLSRVDAGTRGRRDLSLLAVALGTWQVSRPRCLSEPLAAFSVPWWDHTKSPVHK